jgi:glutathione S-transferase
MKLFYGAISPFARKVLITAHERGIADQIELVSAALTPVSPDADVSRSNPLGKIPALVRSDGSTLYDSRVICAWLDTQGIGPSLYAPKGADRFDVLRREALADGIMDAAVLMRYEEVLRPEDKRWDGWMVGQQGVSGARRA